MKRFGLILLGGSILVSLCVALAPSLPFWGERHEAHERPQRIILLPKERVGQTFILEEDVLLGVAAWIDTSQALLASGTLELSVEVGGQERSATIDVIDIPKSGIAIFQFETPLSANTGDAGKYMLQLSESTQRITLLFQIDGSKYLDGNLVHSNMTKQGDLAFQLLYKRPSLGSREVHIGYALLLFICGLCMWQGTKKFPGKARVINRQDIYIALGISIVVMLFYSVFLLRPGYWIGPTDFTKDAAYLASAATAFKSFAWPLWTHTICGGLPLMGGIEGNAISIGALFALFMDSQFALMLMNVVEAGIAAAGVFALARLLGASRRGSSIASCIYALSPVYMFKVAIGYSMIGGVFSFAPWVLLFFIAGVKRVHGVFALVSGVCIGLIVLRGEAHIVVVLGLLLIVWAVYDMVAQRRTRALLLLAVCFCSAFFVASSKILPYAEHLTSEPVKLFPYVALLSQENLLFKTLFEVNADHEHVLVLHGKFGEEWGVFGSYVGYVPVLLALAGILFTRRYRIGLLLLLVVSFAMTEGTLYEYVLRFIPPLDALLRMPVRNMMLGILLIAVFAARGFDTLLRYIPIPHVPTLVYLGLILFLVYDLGHATRLAARQDMSHFADPEGAQVNTPQFAKYEVNADVRKNANILLANGYMLPQVCADQNRTVTFIKTVQNETPFASVGSRLVPNGILLTVPHGVRDVFVNERFDSLWTSREAFAMEHADGSLHLITRSPDVSEVSLTQVSPTVYAQQFILLTIFAYLTAGIFYEKVQVWFGKT